jgi:transposase
LTDAQGIPLAVQLTPANTPDIKQLLPLVDAVPPVAGHVGRPRQRPDELLADKGYDSDPHRQELRKRGIRPQIDRRRQTHGNGLGKYRWVVERTISWLHQYRRLRIRFERLPDIHEAFLKIGCSLICMNFLFPWFC